MPSAHKSAAPLTVRDAATTRVTEGLVCFSGVIAWSPGFSRIWNPKSDG